MEDTDDDDTRYAAPANNPNSNPNPNPYSLQFQQLHPQFQHQYTQHQSFLHHNPQPQPHPDHRQRSKLPLIPALRTHPQQPQNPSQYLSDDDEDDDNDDDDDAEEGENANHSAASVSCSSEGTYANAAGAEEEDEGSESIPYAQESTATHLQQQQQQQNENHGHGHGHSHSHSHSHNQFQLLLQQQQQNYLQALQQQQQQSPMNAATPLFCAPSTQNPCPNFLEKSSGSGSRDDWSEAATWALLESWSRKFLQAGKRSLKMDHWFDISKQVSNVTKNPKSDTHCRNRLDTLKKKYKKEKQKAAETGTCSSWIHFKFLDDLLGSGSSEPATATAAPTVYLPYGLDAGEFVCSRPGKICLNQGQQIDDEGPGDSPSEEEDDDYDEDDNTHKNRSKRKKTDDESFRSLADSIKRFGEIYERIESSKRQQMLDLERMRKEFDQELKMRKREILEQTQIELAKILQRSDETDPSVTNMSG